MKTMNRGVGPELPRGVFRTVVADPPWPTSKAARGAKSKWMAGMANRAYPTMTIVDIMNLPVKVHTDILGSVLLLWTTWGNIQNAIGVMEAWGFRYATGMPWLKTLNPGAGLGLHLSQRHIMAPIYGPGVWFQHCTELLLVGRRGKPFGALGNPRPARKGIIISPRLEHSRKPEEVQLWVESAGFPKPYLELFARRPRKGWTVWGNEVESSVSP